MNIDDLIKARTPEQLTKYYINLLDEWAQRKHPYVLFCYDYRFPTPSAYPNVIHSFANKHVYILRVEILDDRYAQVWSINTDTLDKKDHPRILILRDQPKNFSQFPKPLRAKGVYISGKNRDKFGARIFIDGKCIYLGSTFETFEKAQTAYIKALKAFKPEKYNALADEYKLPEDRTNAN
jgi:hypothetical protein